MADHIINVRVDDKIAAVVGDPLYVCGNSDYIVKFNFDAEWADHAAKTARFVKSNKKHVDVPFTGDQCNMPRLDNTPLVRIGVFAGNLSTTTPAIVNAQRSILCGSGSPEDPPKNVYNQLMEKLDEILQSGTGGKVAVDDTLSQTGMAADAAATGAAIGKLSEEIERHYDLVEMSGWGDMHSEAAYLNDYGLTTDHAGSAVSDFIKAVPGTDIIYSLHGIDRVTYVVALYDSEKNFVPDASVKCQVEGLNGGSWVQISGSVTIPDGVAFFRVMDKSQKEGSFVYYSEESKYRAVLYTEQTLTDEQKSQARANIGAATVQDVIEEMNAPAMLRVTETPGATNRFSLENAYLSNDGTPVAHNSYVTSEFIKAIPGTTIEYENLQCIIDFSYVIGVYDANKNFIADAGVTYKDPSNSGSGKALSGTYTLPQNAAYFRLGSFVHLSSGQLGGSVTYSIEVSTFDPTVNDDKQWTGRKWVAFGTSFTDTACINAESGEPSGKYVPYLADMSGLVVVNHGIAGGTIAAGGLYGGSASILTKILETDVSDADLITIEGFVNDFACAIALGKPGDSENTTLCGALYLAIKHCLENSNATVVLLTETTGRVYTLSSTGNEVNYTVGKKNGLDLLQNDYNDTIVKMAQYMGVHVIDAGRKSQINEFSPAYLEDHLHHSHLGGKQYAATIWEELKNIHVTSAVTVE